MLGNFRDVSSFQDIQKRFIVSARKIMCEHYLVYNNDCWEITSLELYLRLNENRNLWFDTATDGDHEQQKNGTWYVSKKKGPGFWRMDITAGDIERNIHAGFLIRQINKDSGPSKALHTIVRGYYQRTKWPDDDVRRLNTDFHGQSIFSGRARLKPRPSRLESDLWVGPRIGLAKTHSHVNAELRVATWKDKGLRLYVEPT